MAAVTWMIIKFIRDGKEEITNGLNSRLRVSAVTIAVVAFRCCIRLDTGHKSNGKGSASKELDGEVINRARKIRIRNNKNSTTCTIQPWQGSSLPPGEPLCPRTAYHRTPASLLATTTCHASDTPAKGTQPIGRIQRARSCLATTTATVLFL
jgi:hypothetical protein